MPFHGGAIVGEGSSGCVLRPAVVCAGVPSAQEGRVSKLMARSLAEQESSKLQFARTALTLLPAGAADYFIVGDDACVPRSLPPADVRALKRQCKHALPRPVIESLQRGDADALQRVRVINQVDGGVTLGELATTLRTVDDMTHMCRLIVDLLNALRMLNDRGVMHGDIKLGNLVMLQDPTAAKIRLIDWSHAHQVSAYYTTTGLRHSQDLDEYMYIYNHPPGAMLLDLQEPDLQRIYASFEDGSPTDELIRVAVEVATRNLSSSKYVDKQAQITNHLWTQCLNEQPVKPSSKAALDFVATFVTSPIGSLSMDCSLLFVSALVNILVNWSSRAGRDAYADCILRYKMDSYGLLISLVNLVVTATQPYVDNGTLPAPMEHARSTVLAELANHVVYQADVSVEWLRHRFARLYSAPPLCTAERALPYDKNTTEPSPAPAALVPGGASVAPQPVPQARAHALTPLPLARQEAEVVLISPPSIKRQRM